LKKLRDLYHDYVEQGGPIGTLPATLPVDVRGITHTITAALASAGLDTRCGVARLVTETIEQALASTGLSAQAPADLVGATTTEGPAVDITAPESSAPDDTSSGPLAQDEPAHPGDFVTRSFSSEVGPRTYKLYVPASYTHRSEERVPLIVMLHGCTQDPQDFAAGTRMNALADQHGFVVAYPAQEAHANGSKCWNWFRREDQSRDRGEPALIAGITRQVAGAYSIDERRIFVAGLSAGAAMAVVVAATYPELYAALGVHSGLPYGCAHDVPSAFAAMKRGAPYQTSLSRRADPARHSDTGPAIPTIIFHGDHDVTVNASNADAIVEQARVANSDDSVLTSTVYRGTSPNGRAYTRATLSDGTRRPVIEHWILHGAGHAWSGGSPGGSFTDPAGPDASAEMVRFFYSQHRAGSA
jgi:poly(hydroxyalkanoate) depolymerase family esterase